MGIIFGVFLQKGGATQYEVILNQLLLKDFTVTKIMLSAIFVGMFGVHLLKSLGLAELQPKEGSVGINIWGGLIFGAAFAILGYCPGTVVGAMGNGYLDAIAAGFTGMLVGSMLFAKIYPKVSRTILKQGYFGNITFPELLKIPRWAAVIIFAGIVALILYLLEHFGL
jgi:hypothetical protein